ncbi:MAG: AMP-binding protein [Spirochaetales bacterium]|nr:AMP-binding protein [Spirochaetales bacterium]
MILHNEFVKTAKKFSKKIAIIDKMTGVKVPYSRALIGAYILKNKFSAYSSKYIGIMIPTSAGAMLATIGALFAGKIPVMINYSTGAEENSIFAMKECGFDTIITSRALLEKISCPLIPGMICIEDIMQTVTTKDKILAALVTKLPNFLLFSMFPKTFETDTAVILFTSGSEKDPKIVQLSHKNLYTNAKASVEALEIYSNDIILSVLPLFHVFGIQTNFWLPLLTGMTAVTYANPLDYKNVAKIIKSEKCTMIAATPIFLSGYTRSSKPGDFETLTLVVAGADKTPEWLREDYKTKHNIDILEGYGTTETSPVISVNRKNSNKPGSIGLPLEGVEVKITDIDSDEILPNNSEGKIYVKGDLVMKGYLNSSENSKVIKDGWYYTGDIGLLDDDGFLWHKGRLKRFVKIGGEMVSLLKIETVLSEIITDHDIEFGVIEESCDIKGATLTAVFTKEIDRDNLIKQLGQKLPPIYIPKKYITVNELPKMGSGKIDYRKTTEMIEALVTK